ncbi:MAG TPA: AI-2E family transporter [Planctomycetota bacterium]|nr:AI-2E family transporter [Planctomycetota bacterium]
MLPAETEPQSKSLPPPWDRIFSLGTRTFVWALLVAIVYILRPFFLLIFLTFVFAYIQAHGVDGLQHRISNRPLRVTIVGLVFLGTILATAFTLFPQIENQTSGFLRNLTNITEKADQEIAKQLRQYPQLQRFLGRDAAPGGGGNGTEPQAPVELKKEDRFVTNFVMQLIGGGDAAEIGPKEDGRQLEARIRKLVDIGSSVLGYVSSFLLSLLFSFLIVLDLSKIKRGITGLSATKIGFIYDEVAENIATFGKVLGRALEAQLIIAICNTIFTAIGAWLMGLPSLMAVSAIVFLCSFIPVAGVFISSTPICLLALEGGRFGLLFVAIAMILLVHTIETYILNPKIYGHHMRMNPVFVLIVLTVAGKLVGIWGLVLGIPIVNYFFRHAIRYPKDQPDLTAL